MQMEESTGSSAVNKSFSSSSWSQRVAAQAGSLLAGGWQLRGGSRVPQTKRGPRPLHPRDNSDGGHQEKARTPATKVWVEATEGPFPGDPSEPSRFVPAS